MADDLRLQRSGTRKAIGTGLAIGAVLLVIALAGPPLVGTLFPGDGTGSPGNPARTREVQQRNEAQTLPKSSNPSGTPAPATNQCWDTATSVLRDKTSPTSVKQTKETAVGLDRSPGPPAPPSGNATSSGAQKSPNAVRPPGVTDC
jgi:hypothetical protein